jgi:hypothetical protein
MVLSFPGWTCGSVRGAGGDDERLVAAAHLVVALIKP